jgi:hypothetical protein
MAKTRGWLAGCVGLLVLAGSMLASCGSATHVDMYFGTDAGADFAQPGREAGLGTADAGPAGPDAADAGVD